MSKLAIVILAAGKGTRMGNPDIPKVMVELSGKPLIGYVYEQAFSLNPDIVISIIGHKREVVTEYTLANFPSVEFAIQHEQLGTGHAVQQTEKLLESFEGDVLILSGDVPLITYSTLSNFISQHQTSQATLSILSTSIEQPTGYGRIIRNTEGEVERIVEEKDASDSERLVKEINSGIYIVKSDILFESLQGINSMNAQKELYLTDIVGIIQHKGLKVCAFTSDDAQELQGINRPEELSQALTYLESRVESGSGN